jgi:D-alanyl-D-alanine carboxypeptidase
MIGAGALGRWSLFCLVVSTSSAAEGPPAPDPDRLREIVQAEAAKRGTRAVEFGFWRADTKILTMALGPSMTTVPAATNMHYRIGGIALTFMSTLRLMMVEQGKLSLDDKISRWLPDLLKADEVSVRMLVANTAGHIVYVRVQDFVDLQLKEPFRTFTDQELIAYSVRDGKMNFPPGSSQQYSHTDNVLLGQVIQRAAHKSMREL